MRRLPPDSKLGRDGAGFAGRVMMLGLPPEDAGGLTRMFSRGVGTAEGGATRGTVGVSPRGAETDGREIGAVEPDDGVDTAAPPEPVLPAEPTAGAVGDDGTEPPAMMLGSRVDGRVVKGRVTGTLAALPEPAVGVVVAGRG